MALLTLGSRHRENMAVSTLQFGAGTIFYADAQRRDGEPVHFRKFGLAVTAETP